MAQQFCLIFLILFMGLLYMWINSLSKHNESPHTSYWSALPIFHGPVILSSPLAVSEFSSVYCVRCAFCVRARIRLECPVITCTFVHGFQNNLALLFSLRCRGVIWNICSGRLKGKVTLEGQMMKWS